MPATRTDVARRLSARPGLAGAHLAGSRSTLGASTGADWAWLTGDPYPPAGPATEQAAMGLPPFGRGLALLCNAGADTDWHAVRYDVDAGVSVRVPNQPNVVDNPDPSTTAWNYRWAAIADGVLFGNHFALLGDPDPNNAYRPGWLVPLAADQVWMMTDPGNPAWFEWVVGGEEIDPGAMLHVPFGNRSGELLGLGVLRQYADWLGIAVAAEVHAGGYFAGGALPPAVLQSPTALTPDQAAELKTSWRAMTNTREPVVLPTGYVLTPIVSSAEAAQLVESRQWNAEAAAMVLGIPPYKLGLPGPTMTYQNTETADIDFVRDSVTRYASPLAAAFTKWLMPRGVSVRFDYTSRMRADQRTTAEVLTTYTGASILSVDEARAVLGRPPLPEPAPAPAPENLEPPADTPAPEPTPEATPEVAPDGGGLNA
jgi:HK97 family phage portal protein